MVTSWPVLTETLHMLDFNVNMQIDFLKWVNEGAVELFNLKKNHISRIIKLSEKYSNVPVDFADASLLVISEVENIKEIVTIDSDFYVYRNIRNDKLINVFNK